VHRIPSLDGLRAFSIALVLAGHSIPNGQWNWFFWKVFGNGDLGVSIFFVISGFLITSLLLKEYNDTGEISPKHFYLRRAFRILPPFYAFLMVLLVLKGFGVLRLNLRGWTEAVTFLRDYLFADDGWTMHIWSLSVEEQFYLLWPVCLALAGISRSKRVALTLICAAPLIRISCHLILPAFGWREQLMFHMRVDGLMMGCALALFDKQLAFKWNWVWPAALILFVLSPYLITRWHGYYLLPFGYTLDNLAIAYVLLYAVRNPRSRLGRILNNRFIAHIGVISYSLYLWQGLFLGLWRLPWSIVAAFAAAEISWRLIERPALRLRDRVIEGRRALAMAA
jgi:peptidoglycan/LPS O-acetylase OafA/YrhL